MNNHYSPWIKSVVVVCFLLCSLYASQTIWGHGKTVDKSRASSIVSSPKTKSIEQLRVGDRVVSRNPDLKEEDHALPSKVNPATWKKLILHTVNTWADGTKDDINIETLQSPQWLESQHAKVGAKVDIPLDLIEMGLAEDMQAEVLAIEPCPAIKQGSGRVILTTINHLNSDVHELLFQAQDGRKETVRPTGFHKFYSVSRKSWVSARELKEGEQVPGASGLLTLVSSRNFPGVHRVYNMTVEHEHVYQVAKVGALVHNMDCTKYANKLQNQIGGKVVTIKPKPFPWPSSRPPVMGPYPGNPSGDWYFHDVVVLGGRVYDEFTGPNGMPIDQWKKLWEYGKYFDWPDELR